MLILVFDSLPFDTCGTLNLIFVPRFGMAASSVILLLTSVVYAGFMMFLALIVGRRLARE